MMSVMHTSAPVSSGNFLRRAVLADALLSGATGALMIFGASFLSDWLALPAQLLLGAGLVLVPYVAFVVYVGARPNIPPWGVWLIIAANVAWTLASVGLLVTGAIAPNIFGYAFVVAQAAAVAGLGELQYIGLRR
jgi:hypothetical protein